MTPIAGTATAIPARSAFLRHGLLPLAALAASIALQQSAVLDREVADAFFDRDAGRFVGAHSLWAEGVIHDGGRKLITVIAVASLCTALAALFAPRLAALRRPALYVCTAIALGTGLVAAGKATTAIACPREITRYGGARPFVGLFDARPAPPLRGACFPGGHSSGAFSLISFFYALRERSQRAAYGALAAGIGLGSVFAVGQWSRGAHFPSHDLASLAICAIAASALYFGPFGGRLWPRPQ